MCSEVDLSTPENIATIKMWFAMGLPVEFYHPYSAIAGWRPIRRMNTHFPSAHPHWKYRVAP